MRKEQTLHYLQKLNDKLAEENATGELYIVGGTAMALLYNDNRITYDIDGEYAPKDSMERLAREIAEEENLPKDWLNDAVSRLGFDFESDTQSVPLDVGDNLMVSVASPEFMLYLKIWASRRSAHDIADIIDLCHYLNIETELQLYNAISPFGGVDGAMDLYVEDIISML